MLPIPKDPNFHIRTTDYEYLNPTGDEDEELLATGAWDDLPSEIVEDASEDEIEELPTE